MGLSGESEVAAASVMIEDGFVDIGLPITETFRSADGVTSVTARGKLGDAPAGFIIDVFPGWKPQKLEDAGVVVHWGRVSYRSLGGESDHFVSQLGSLYEIKPSVRRMPARIEFSAVCLSGDPTDLANSPVRMKLFFEPGDEASYAEVYTALDLPGKRVDFNERDPDYREPLLRALGG